MLIALLTTLRGTAFLYQGQELGLPQADLPFAALRDPEGIAFWPDYKGRDGCRTPMPWSTALHGGFSVATPWLPVPDEHLPLSVATQEADATSLLRWVRGWLAWRRTVPALRDGDIQFRDVPAPLLCFTRGSGPNGVTIVVNLGDTAAALSWQGSPPVIAYDLGASWQANQLVIPPACGAVLAGA